jgi:hypothetical protein
MELFTYVALPDSLFVNASCIKLTGIIDDTDIATVNRKGACFLEGKTLEIIMLK